MIDCCSWKGGRVLICEYMKQIKDGACRRESGSGTFSAEKDSWLNAFLNFGEMAEWLKAPDSKPGMGL